MKKRCTKCMRIKRIRNFHKKQRGKYGVTSTCKLCCILFRKAYYIKNRKKELDCNKKYIQTKKGKLIRKKSNKKYRYSDKGRLTKAKTNGIRRAKNKNVINSLTLLQWENILLTQNNICNICSLSFDTTKATRDHIIPVSKGGGLTKDNVQALCGSCNSRKGNKTMKEYIKLEVQ